MNAPKKSITNKVLNSLENLVKVELINDWPAYAADCDEHFGILDMFKLALPFVSEETKQNILKPITGYVNKYVTDKVKDWGDSIPLLIDSDIEALKEDLDDQSFEFDLELDQAKAIFSGADATTWKGKGANKLQLALSLIQGDVSVAIENAAGGNFSWGEFFKKYIVQGIINIMLFSLIGGGIPGFIVAAVVEMVQLGIHAHSAQSRIMNSLAEGLFPKIAEELMTNVPVITCDIAKQFDKQKEDITEVAYGLIIEEKQSQDEIIYQAKQQKDKIALEEKRQRAILDALFARTNLIYKTLFGKDIEKADMAKVAAMVDSVETE